MKKKLKDKPLKVIFEYEPTPDSEERINKAFEFLLSEGEVRAENDKNP